jgi:microcystin-dependent protein
MTLQSSKPTAMAVNALLSPDKAGFMQLWGGSPTAIPTGWLKCDGSAVSRATYSTLFGVVGVSFGVGDGSTTFNLPSLDITINAALRTYIIKLYDDTNNATYSFSSLSITQYAAIGSAPAQSGAARLTNNESVSWRNFAGSADLALKVNTSDALEYNGFTLMTAAGLISAAAITGTLAAANGGTGQSSYAIGDLLYASGATALSKLADIATGNALISGGVGAAPSWGKIGLTTHVSGTLPSANGGTGQSSYAIGDLLYASGATALSKLASIAAGNVLITGGVGAAPAWGKALGPPTGDNLTTLYELNSGDASTGGAGARSVAEFRVNSIASSNSLAAFTVGNHSSQLGLVYDRDLAVNYLWTRGTLRFVTTSSATLQSPVTGMTGYSELGSMTSAGAWFFGAPGHTGAQTAYGSHFDLISATVLASTYIKLANSDFTKQSFIGQESSTVANSFVTGAPAYSLGIAANNGIYLSGSASTLHGFMTSAGAFTLGPASAGSLLHTVNGIATFQASLTGASAVWKFNNTGAAVASARIELSALGTTTSAGVYHRFLRGAAGTTMEWDVGVVGSVNSAYSWSSAIAEVGWITQVGAWTLLSTSGSHNLRVSNADAVVRIRGTDSAASSRTTRLQFEDYAGAIGDVIQQFQLPNGNLASSKFVIGYTTRSSITIGGSNVSTDEAFAFGTTMSFTGMEAAPAGKIATATYAGSWVWGGTSAVTHTAATDKGNIFLGGSTVSATNNILRISGASGVGAYVDFAEVGTVRWAAGADTASGSFNIRQGGATGSIYYTLDSAGGSTQTSTSNPHTFVTPSNVGIAVVPAGTSAIGKIILAGRNGGGTQLSSDFNVGAIGDLTINAYRTFNVNTNTGGASVQGLTISVGGQVSVPTSIGASSTTTGSLIVAGGVGISGNVYVGGQLNHMSGNFRLPAAAGGLGNATNPYMTPSDGTLSGLFFTNATDYGFSASSVRQLFINPDGVRVRGRRDGAASSAGDLGEVITISQSTPTAVGGGTSTQFVDVLDVSAGNVGIGVWSISGVIHAQSGGASPFGSPYMAVSDFSANNQTDHVFPVTFWAGPVDGNSAVASSVHSITGYVIAITASSHKYIKIRNDFTGGPPTYRYSFRFTRVG